jgi:uncharacterized membrane protein HdeD (DUF308 family)
MVRLGSSLAVVRQGMWGFLLFAGVAWLAIAWTVMRLEPAGVAGVAGPVVLFGALTEAVRALAPTRTWWLNAGMALLFAVTAVVLWASGDATTTTPVALLGWYLMVRGAADVAVSMLTRETDRIWGLLMVVGVLEAGLGFYAASPLARSTDLALTVLGGLGLLRGVADLVTALRLREIEVARADVLDLPPERAAGVAGYTAGRADFETAPASTLSARTEQAKPASPVVTNERRHLSARTEQAKPASPAVANERRVGPRHRAPSKSKATPAPESFHDEVLRASADLDSMLALAGVTGAAVGAGMAEHYDIPEIPDTPEGVEASPEAPAAG